MKRKLGISLNLPPLKIPSSSSRAENNALKKALESDFSFVSPPSSPFIDRPKISWTVETELREACVKIIQSTGAPVESNAVDPVLSSFVRFQKVMKEKEKDENRRENEQMRKELERLPPRQDSTTQEPVAVAEAPEESGSEAADIQEVPREPMKEESGKGINYSRPRSAHSVERSAFPVRRDSLHRSKHVRSTTQTVEDPPLPSQVIPERPKTAPLDSSDVSIDTPLSGSTDAPHQHSTNMTSAAYTPSRPSLHKSSQQSNESEAHHTAVAKADAQAAEWMRQQRLKSGSVDDPKPPPSRGLVSRGRSFTSDFKDYVRRASKSRERHARSASRGEDSEPPRAASSHGWQSWGFRRQASKASLKDFTREQAPSQTAHDMKSDVDLNRDLPPLPPLSSYREAAGSTTHIATLMHVKPASPVIKSKSGRSDSLTRAPEAPGQHQAAKPKVTTTRVDIPHQSPAQQPPQQVSRKLSIAESKASSNDSCFSPVGAQTPDKSIDLVAAAALARSTENLRPATASGLPKRSQTTKSASAASQSAVKMPIARYSLVPHQRAPSQPILLGNRSAASSVLNLPPRPATRDATSSFGVSRAPPNFSRKFGASETELRQPMPGSDLKHAVSAAGITALPPMPTRRPSGLRRMLSTLSGRKDKKLRDTKKDPSTKEVEKGSVKASVILEENGTNPKAAVRA